MGVDGVGSKVATTVPKTVEAKPVEAPKPAEPAAPAVEAKKPSEGFDLQKKKLMSVSGRFAAHKPNVPVREDLKDLISGQRMAMNAGGAGPAANANATKIGESHAHGPDCGCGPTLKDGTLNTASSVGKSPGPRAEASDFAGAAKKANPTGKPEEIDAAANKAARAALEKDFGVKVKDGDKPWTTEELSRTHESFSQMPAGDRDALKGLDLIRNSKASAKSQAEMGDKGTIAGEYMPNATTTDGKRDKNAAIQLYDAAFPAAGKDPEAARKQSMHVIIHEAGHAVEGRKHDEAVAAYNGAVDQSNAANKDLSPKAKANSEQWGIKQKGDKEWPAGSTNRASEDYGSTSGKDKPGMAFHGAQNDVMTKISALQDAKTPADIDKAQKALDAAKTKRDAALKGMSGHDKESKANDWVAATDKQEATARAFADSNAKYLPLKAETDKKMTELKGVATVTETKLDDGTTKIDTKSKELQAFEKARGAGTKKEEGAVSGYGASKAPEGYAEAYALYQRDPKKLKEVAPEQYKYFHAKHKNAND